MITIILISTLILWVSFVALMEYVDGRNRYELNWPQKIAVILFVIIDVIYNYTIGTVIFWEFADNDRKTLTARLKNILHSGLYDENEWRFKLALFMCKYMISPWDFNHCGMGMGK